MARTHWTIRRLAASLTALAAMVATTTAGPPAGKETEHPLVVHEWGTFTNFSGSDGVQLDFRPLGDSDLPRFINSNTGIDLFSKRNIFARQRMETPVTYFYSDVERDVKVSVKFPAGRLTEYYPPPAIAQKQRMPWNNEVTDHENDVLDWGTVHLIPNSLLETKVGDKAVAARLNQHIGMALVPWTDDEMNPYYQARRTDSNLLYVRRDEGAPGAGDFRGDHFEKFLFYRGVGKFDLPVRVQSVEGDKVRVVNPGKLPIRSVFVVQGTGSWMRSAFLGDVEPGKSIDGKLPPFVEDRSFNPYQDLDSKLIPALVREGLFQKEAEAMVNTWRLSWYSEFGTRVFYMVPQEAADAILPLTVEPKPDKTVRVFVARMELLTSQEEKELLSLLKDSAAAKPGAEAALVQALQRRGRLGEPALLHVAGAEESPLKTEALRVRDLLLKRPG